MLVRLTLVATISLFCCAQERFDSGKFKGFTKSPSEHIIVELDEPFQVRSLRGVVLSKVDREPLVNVTFEIRDESSGQVRGTKTDRKGCFKMRSIPDGTYTFKATRNGFQSVVGTVVVSEKANRKKIINIQMPLGV